MHSEGVLVIKFNILEPGFMRTVVQRVDQFTHLLVMNGLGSLFKASGAPNYILWWPARGMLSRGSLCAP